MFCFLFLAPYARTTRYEEASFFLGKPSQKKARFARAPYYYVLVVRDVINGRTGGGGKELLCITRKNRRTLTLELSVVVDTGYKVYYSSEASF